MLDWLKCIVVRLMLLLEFQLVNILLLVLDDRVLDNELIFQTADPFLHLGLFFPENVFMTGLHFYFVFFGFREVLLLEGTIVAFVPCRIFIIY